MHKAIYCSISFRKLVKYLSIGGCIGFQVHMEHFIKTDSMLARKQISTNFKITEIILCSQTTGDIS